MTMTLLLVVKTFHILGATVFLGTGLGTAWFKWRADRSGDLRVIAFAQQEVVFADWCFTVPSGVVMPATGLLMVYMLNMSWLNPWVLWGVGGYVVTGLLWLPAAFLQIRMRNLAAKALAAGTDLPAEFHRANRVWMALGFPAFLIASFVLYMMVSRWVPGW